MNSNRSKVFTEFNYITQHLYCTHLPQPLPYILQLGICSRVWSSRRRTSWAVVAQPKEKMFQSWRCGGQCLVVANLVNQLPRYWAIIAPTVSACSGLPRTEPTKLPVYQLLDALRIPRGCACSAPIASAFVDSINIVFQYYPHMRLERGKVIVLARAYIELCVCSINFCYIFKWLTELLVLSIRHRVVKVKLNRMGRY